MPDMMIMPITPADALIRAFPHAAILAGNDGAVIGFNDTASRLFPLLRQDYPLSFAIRDPSLLSAVTLTGQDRIPRKLEVMERLPVERVFAVHVSPVMPLSPVMQISPNDTGSILVVFDDLTAGRSLERMRVDFIANASHELRTPLASLLGFVETLKGSARDDAAARDRFLGIMEAQAQRMARLIDDLLSLSHIELNAHIPPRDTVDIISVVRQIADGLRPLASERAVELQVRAHAQEAMVLGDRDELLRVFENLIENAIKYGYGGGKIMIETALSPPDMIEMTVRDFGPGIAVEHVPRLTERFYRVNVAASRDAGGTGLGLAIVKHVVVRHGGRLEIESVLGEGTTFKVFLKLNRLPS